MQGGQQIIVLVVVTVIAHVAALGELLRQFAGDSDAVLRLFAGEHDQLHSVQCLAHIAAAAPCDPAADTLCQMQRCAKLLLHQTEAACHRTLQLLRRNRLELKHRGTADEGIVDGEMGVLCGGGDEGNLSVFHVLQKQLLLFLVEILDFVQIEQDAVHAGERPHLCHHIPDVCGRRRGTVQLVECHGGAVGDDACHGGFSHAGGTIEDHVGDFPALNDSPQGLSRSEQLALSHHVIQCLRANPVC